MLNDLTHELVLALLLFIANGKKLREVQNSADIIATEHRKPKFDPTWDIYIYLLEKGVTVRWIIDRSFEDDKEFLMS